MYFYVERFPCLGEYTEGIDRVSFSGHETSIGNHEGVDDVLSLSKMIP